MREQFAVLCYPISRIGSYLQQRHTSIFGEDQLCQESYQVPFVD